MRPASWAGSEREMPHGEAFSPRLHCRLIYFHYNQQFECMSRCPNPKTIKPQSKSRIVSLCPPGAAVVSGSASARSFVRGWPPPEPPPPHPLGSTALGQQYTGKEKTRSVLWLNVAAAESSPRMYQRTVSLFCLWIPRQNHNTVHSYSVSSNCC